MKGRQTNISPGNFVYSSYASAEMTLRSVMCNWSTNSGNLLGKCPACSLYWA